VTEVLEKLEGSRFDVVVFYASLEHMTLEERGTAMRQAWQLLAPGDLWCVVDTPNRLWYHDGHTSMLPYFHWLPDDLAFAYSRRSPRAGFRECYRVPDTDSRLHFQRRGRGVSYHELELALGPRRS
jgi:S-adenosylmethionine-dependent methyltransferase